MSIYRKQLEDWLKELDVKADTVLDIGGAQGEVKNRVKGWNVKNYKVLDLPEWDLNHEFADCDNFLDIYDTADVVFCLEVFEYLVNPIMAMANIETVLKANGKAYITFPLCYPIHQEVEYDSLRYTETGIRRLADSANLKVSNVWYRRDKSSFLQIFYQADGMRMAKGYDHSIYGYIVEFTK